VEKGRKTWHRLLFAVIWPVTLWGWLFAIAVISFAGKFFMETDSLVRGECAMGVAMSVFEGATPWLLTLAMALVLRRVYSRKILLLANLPVLLATAALALFSLFGGWQG
jgi:hypothetical protein